MPGIGEKFSKFASGTKKQAQVLVETNRLNSAIHKEEAAIQAAYSQIGKSYFETHSGDAGIPANFREMLDGILGRMRQIEELRAKIAEMKGVKTCPGCGAEAESETLFCSKCGHRFEEEAPGAAPSAPAAVFAPMPAEVSPPMPAAVSAPMPAEVSPPVPAAVSPPVPVAVSPPAAEEAPPQAPAAPVCPACGSPLDEGTIFCGQCGHKLG